uniref:Uncharacterized protein n=1 Tax=Plectus sambesii TaxID=2011161 RepID=A0A914XFM5_9BILA
MERRWRVMRYDVASEMASVRMLTTDMRSLAMAADAADPLRAQLVEVRSLITSTQKCIGDLNNRFGGDRKPQSIFLREYEQLTEHLHKLQQQEESIRARLLDERRPASARPSSERSAPDMTMSGAFRSPIGHSARSPPRSDSPYSGESPEDRSEVFEEPARFAPLLSPSSPADSRPGQSSAKAYSNGPMSPSPSVSPKRGRHLICLHLPFGQHSRVEVKAGVRARDAIWRILQKRNITPQMCVVRRGKDPTSEPVDLQMDLETLAQTLEPPKELWVQSSFLPMVMSIKHSFVRKTFFTLTYCDVCQKPIWLQGYRCELCLFKFHPRCWARVPNYCDLIQQIPQNVEMIERLTEACRQHGGANGVAASEILARFHGGAVAAPSYTALPSTSSLQEPPSPSSKKYSNGSVSDAVDDDLASGDGANAPPPRELRFLSSVRMLSQCYCESRASMTAGMRSARLVRRR